MFILRFEKWAGRTRTIRSHNPTVTSTISTAAENTSTPSSWTWEGRPTHRNLTIQTALRHEALRVQNTQDNQALEEVEASFNTLKTLFDSTSEDELKKSKLLNLDTTSVFSSELRDKCYSDVDMEEFQRMLHVDVNVSMRRPRRRVPDTSANTIGPLSIASSKWSDTGFLRLQTLSNKVSNQEVTDAIPSNGVSPVRSRLKVITPNLPNACV